MSIKSRGDPSSHRSRLMEHTMSAAKRRVLNAVKQFRAMSLLSCNMTKRLRDGIDQDIARIPDIHKKELVALEERYVRMATDLAQLLGLKGTLAECQALVEEMQAGTTEMPWYPKHDIEGNFFTRLGEVVPDWKAYPPHTRIGIDVHGHLAGSLEYRLLEASLFESAALLWNDTASSEVHERPVSTEGKLTTKRYHELQRSTIRAIFAFIEGYLNGIAYDIQLTTDITALSVESREKLLERSDDGKARFKTFRQKILAYPRIALQLDQSPISETNEHVAWLLEKEKELRDAIVHPTPRPEAGRSLIREQVYYNINIDLIRDFLDHAIGMVRYVDGILNGKFGRVNLWLRDRGNDGQFAPETFH